MHWNINDRIELLKTWWGPRIVEDTLVIVKIFLLTCLLTLLHFRLFHVFSTGQCAEESR